MTGKESLRTMSREAGFPTWDKEDVRFFEFSGDRLIIQTPPVPASEEYGVIFECIKKRELTISKKTSVLP